MRVIKNYLYNATYQIFVLLVPLITTPYLSRVLGPTGVGINSFTNSIIQYFILFGSIGVNLYGNRQIAYVKKNKKKMTQTFFEIFLMKIITIVLSYGAFLIFLSYVDRFEVYYLAQSISIIAAAFDISWFFMGVENFATTVLRNLVVKIITLVSIFGFVKSSNDLKVYILILSLSLLIGNFTLFPSLKKYLTVPNMRELHLWKHLIPSISLFIPQIATQIYLVVNKTMLGSMTSVQSAGYFDQSDKIIKMILAVVTATGTVMLPRVASAYANGQSKKTLSYLYVSFEFVTGLSLPMMFGVAAVSSKFVPLFFTSKFNNVIPLMVIESSVILLIAWSNVIGTQYLVPTGQTRGYTRSVVLGAIVNIVANIPLIYVWGAVGTALATVLSEITVTVYQLWIIRRQVRYHYLFADIKKYLLSGVIMCIVVYYLNGVLADTWVMLIVEMLVGIVLYGLLLVIFKVHIIRKIILTFR